MGALILISETEEEFGNFVEIVWNELDGSGSQKVGFAGLKLFLERYNCKISDALFQGNSLF